jgi:WD40 repeat protein
MKRRTGKFAFLLLVPLALYFYIAERNSWRPKTIAYITRIGNIDVHFSPDGRFLAIQASRTSSLSMYDVKAYRIMRTFASTSLIEFPKADRFEVYEFEMVRRCTYSLPDFKIIASLNNIANTIPIYPYLKRHTPVKAIEAHKEGEAVNLENTKSGIIFRTIDFRNNPIYNLDTSPSGDFLATAHHDGTVKLWRIK